MEIPIPLQWRHNDHDSVSNHQPHGYLLNRLFRRRSKITSKLRVTGLCVGNSPGPVNSPHKGPVTRKMFPFDDVIMQYDGVFIVNRENIKPGPSPPHAPCYFGGMVETVFTDYKSERNPLQLPKSPLDIWLTLPSAQELGHRNLVLIAACRNSVTTIPFVIECRFVRFTKIHNWYNG